MILLDRTEVLKELCKQSGKYGMYISFDKDQIWSEICKAVPFLDFEEHIQILMDGHGWMLFDSRVEMETCYRKTVRDDGPTELNPYNGDVRVYALTCSLAGELENENT